MMQSIQYACFALAAAGLLMVGQAMATVVNFTAGEGYADGDLTNNVNWATDDTNDGLGGNIVSTGELGYNSEAGVVSIAGYTNWIKGIYSEDLPLDSAGKTVTAKARFKYSTTGTLPTIGQDIGIFSLLFDDGAGNIVRTALRRRNGAGTPQVFLWNAGAWSPLALETAVGIDTAVDESDWLELTITLVKNSDAGTDDWTYSTVLTNVATGLEVTRYDNIGGFSPALAAGTNVRAAISSTMQESATFTSDRKMDRFEVTSNIFIPPTTIIEGSVGDGDFEYPMLPGGGNGALAFSNHPSWFNASQWEGETFTLTNNTWASSQPHSRAAMPFQLRKQVNNTGYTVTRAGVTFDLSYDFGRVGGGWDGDESMRTFLFTADAPVNGALIEGNMTEFAEVIYTFPAGEFWTTFATNAFYTTTESDIGKTFYFGMVHLNPGGSPVFPRLDVLRLVANENKIPIIREETGDGDFEFPETPGSPGDVTGPLTFTNHPYWYNASAWEGPNFSTDENTGGSPQPDSRMGMPFQNRVQVNNTGYTVAAAGQEFDLSYGFVRFGVGYDEDESMRTFLFTTPNTVDGALTTNDMTEVASVTNVYPTDFASSFSTNGFYTTTTADIGKTFYFGMEHLNPGGAAVFPRINLIDLCVTLPVEAPSGPSMSIMLNGANLEIIWDSEIGSSYQLQTNNDLTTTNWTDHGSATVGDGSTQTNSVPISGDELYIRTEVE